MAENARLELPLSSGAICAAFKCVLHISALPSVQTFQIFAVSESGV
jgi:hypothetical protein